MAAVREMTYDYWQRSLIRLRDVTQTTRTCYKPGTLSAMKAGMLPIDRDSRPLCDLIFTVRIGRKGRNGG